MAKQVSKDSQDHLTTRMQAGPPGRVCLQPLSQRHTPYDRPSYAGQPL